MAQQIQPGAARKLQLLAAQIPADVAKSIDPDELQDRLVHAAQLLDRANSAASPTVRKAIADQVAAVLGAQPRARTREQLAALLTKAAATSGETAARYRAEVERLQVEHPIAPSRRPLAKAKTLDGVVAVYDAGGKLVGVVDPAKIVAVDSAGSPAPKPTADDDVTKQRRRIPTARRILR